jgi:hypothetical protein
LPRHLPTPCYTAAMGERPSIAAVPSDRVRLVYAVGAAALGCLLVRACASSRSGSLPGDLYNQIQDRYVQCITPQDTAIWPGDPRQPECGSVDIRVLGDGVVPPDEEASGITAALCYTATYENPWTTLGTTRHEVKWKSRTSQCRRKRRRMADLSGRSCRIDRWKAFSCPDLGSCSPHQWLGCWRIPLVNRLTMCAASSSGVPDAK